MRSVRALPLYSLVLVAAALLALPREGSAQYTSAFAAVPTPAAIRNARTVFLSNLSADTGLFPDIYSGDSDRGFNELYTAVRASGRFQLVSDPSRADLVMTLRLVAPIDPASVKEEMRPEGFPVPLPLFRLEIYDRPTHYVLWTFTQPIDKALLQKNNDHNFDRAVMRLASDIQALPVPHAAPTQ